MVEFKDDRFVTQYLYRDKAEEFTLGYIAEFSGQGIIKKYKYSDINYMYPKFLHSYKASLDGINWIDEWHTLSGAVRLLLTHHEKDVILGTYYVLPCPQTFKDRWKESTYQKVLNDGIQDKRNELVQAPHSNT